MRRNHLGVGILALLSLVSATAQAQTSPTSSTNPDRTTTLNTNTTSGTPTMVTGVVTSVDPQGKTITVKTDSGTTTYMTSSASWMGTTGIDQVRVGQRVQVNFNPGTGSTLTASRIQVLAPGDSGQVSTSNPILGERADSRAGPDPTVATSTYGRPVSTSKPVFGQDGQEKPADTNPGGTAVVSGSTAPAGTTTMTTTTADPNRFGASSTGTAPAPTSGTMSMEAAAPVTGTVVSVDPGGNTITVRSRDGMTTTYRSDSSTRFVSAGRTVALGDLKSGDSVLLTFSGTGTDRVIAHAEVTTGEGMARTTSTETTRYGTTTTATETNRYGTPPSSSATGQTTGSTASETTRTSARTERDELPETASTLPLVALIGLFAIAAALAVRAARKQSS